MAVSNVQVHWRESSRSPRFFFIDARAGLFVACFLIHPRMWTFFIGLTVMVILGILEYFKFSIPVTFRLLRTFLMGNDKLRGNE